MQCHLLRQCLPGVSAYSTSPLPLFRIALLENESENHLTGVVVLLATATQMLRLKAFLSTVE